MVTGADEIMRQVLRETWRVRFYKEAIRKSKWTGPANHRCRSGAKVCAAGVFKRLYERILIVTKDYAMEGNNNWIRTRG